MQATIKPISGFSLLCIVCLFIASCKGADDKKEPAGPGPDSTTKPITEVLTTGSLDTLYVGRAAFDNIGNGSRLVFSFTFKDADTLTLHGWLLKPGNKFDSLPNIILKNLRPSAVNYGVSKYFGNVVLAPNETNKIKQALTPGMNFVLFAPFLQGNNIAYTIFVTDKITGSKEQILVVAPTGAVANPSPPKVD